MTEILRSNPQLVTTIIFLGFSSAIVFRDLLTGKIPDFLLYICSITMLCYRFACTRKELVIYICSGIISAALFVIARNTMKKSRPWTEVKYSFFCGIYGGPIVIFLGYPISFLIRAVFSIFSKNRGRRDNEKKIPFTPFMMLGTLIVALPPIVKQFAK